MILTFTLITFTFITLTVLVIPTDYSTAKQYFYSNRSKPIINIETDQQFLFTHTNHPFPDKVKFISVVSDLHTKCKMKILNIKNLT